MNKQQTTKQAIDLRAETKARSVRYARSGLALAELLHTVFHSRTALRGGRDVPLFVAWQYETFHAYAEQELGLHGTTARDFVTMYGTLVVEHSFKEEDLPTSITKLRELTRIVRVDAEHRFEWLKKAKTLSCCDFENAVIEYIEGRVPYRMASVMMTAKDHRTLYRALNAGKEDLGTTRNGETLARVLEQWLAQRRATRKVA